jgi:hypothetical protein
VDGFQAGEIPMLSVHGIAAVGGRSRRRSGAHAEALADLSTKNFLLPNTYPTYKDWHGDWQYGGGVYVPTTYSSTTSSTATETTQTTDTQPAGATTHVKKEKKPPPPPPVTTTEPPPATTTEPPPVP